MSFLDSANAFYSEPEETPLLSQPPLRETGAFDNLTEVPATATSPVYTRYNDAGVDTFAPLPQPSDPSFQPASTQPQPAQANSFQFQPWMLLALGAAYVLWNRSQE